MNDLATTRRQLAALPTIAAKTSPEPIGTTRDDPAASSSGRRRLGPRLPAGASAILDAITGEQMRDRAHPDQLDRLSQCIRVVIEECDPSRALPDPGPGGRATTWTAEAGWLLATMPTWALDAWTAEWITDEVAAITSTLIDRHHARTGRCISCDATLETHTLGPLTTTSCPNCDRVAGMQLTASPEAYARQREDARLGAYRATLAAILTPSDKET